MPKLKLLSLTSTLLLTACSGIGDGNAPDGIEIRIGGQSESAEVFECIANSPQAIVSFTNNTQGNFASRATWRSSDESVLVVSDGSFETDEGVFLNGALLPMQAGTATITVEYLTFEDSIDVTVSPMTLELSPVEQTMAQNTALQLRPTAILDGVERRSITSLLGLGAWSVASSEQTTPLTTVDASSGLLTAQADVAGREQATFRIDFCNREKTLAVDVVDQDLQALRIVRAAAPDTALDSLSVPPDASEPVRVIADFSGGLTQDVTGSVNFQFSDTEAAFVGFRGTGVLTTFSEAAGRATQITAEFDPDTAIEGDEIVSAPITLSVADLSLDPDSLQLMPADSTVLAGTGVQFSAQGTFTGAAESQTRDLTRDVSWVSSDADIATISNLNGARGFAFGSSSEFGTIQISARRLSGDGPDTPPSVDLTIGSADGQDNVELTALQVSAPDSTLRRGETLQLSATGSLQNSAGSFTQDLTTSVVWSSDRPDLAVVDNASGRKGVVRAVTDQSNVDVVLRAAFFNQAIQDNEIIGDITVTLNPDQSG